MLTRTTDATFFNSVLNHPRVYPWVKGSKTEPLDVGKVIENRNNILLTGEGGGVLLQKLDIGLYEAHTAVLPDYRGDWTLQMGRMVLDLMFCCTDAVEILTKCPHGNVMASAGAKAIGAVCDFTTRPLWPLNSKLVPIDVYAVRIQDWIKRSDHSFEAGQEVHRMLRAHGVPVDHGTDEDHDRYVGAAWEMIQNGQVEKGVHFYYRWAVMSGYRPITIISGDPLRLDIGNAILALVDGKWAIVKAQPMAAA